MVEDDGVESGVKEAGKGFYMIEFMHEERLWATPAAKQNGMV